MDHENQPPDEAARFLPKGGRAVLRDGVVIPMNGPDSLLEWARAFEARRQIGSTWVGRAWVSTIFLGLDHGHGGTPLWFETMVLGETYGLPRTQWRYSTLLEAQRGHAETVAYVRENVPLWRRAWGTVLLHLGILPGGRL